MSAASHPAPLAEAAALAAERYDAPAAARALTQEELEAALAEAIARMLREEPERLAQLAYRADLPEADFRRAAAAPDAPPALARLFVEREIQRVAFRRQYAAARKDESA